MHHRQRSMHYGVMIKPVTNTMSNPDLSRLQNSATWRMTTTLRSSIMLTLLLGGLGCSEDPATPPPIAGNTAGAMAAGTVAGTVAGTIPGGGTAGTVAGTTGAGTTGACLDRDRDGFQDRACNPNVNGGGGDCDDTSNAINPGRVENCANQIDNNCNGLVPAQDPMCQQACPDADRDGYQDAMCNSNPNNQGGDCNDMNPRVYPGAMEICGNQFDDDCRGGDLPCQPNCTDGDRDGFGLGADCLGTDCNDGDPKVNPYQSEICGDRIDQDCNGRDLECPENCMDRDRDGFGVGDGCLGPDCNDDDPSINVAAVEIINDRIDQDCDGQDLISLNLCDDPDQDGYGTGTGCLGYDCDEADPRVHSGRYEVCGNGLDDDCSRGDQVCTTMGVGECIDMDNDGHGQGACRISGYDCDDGNPNINPYAEEVCNGVDDNCNNEIDECSGRNQVCGEDSRCVGRVGAPCSSSDDCLVGQGLTCDMGSRECRVAVGRFCAESSDCISSAECTEISACDGGLLCYQLEGASCSDACDCTGDLLCNSFNNVCVQCDGDFSCNGEEVCTDGGFCVDDVSVGQVGDNAVLEILELIVECHRTYRGAPSTRGCSRVQVGRDLGSMNGMLLDSLPNDDGVDDYVCESDGEVQNHFNDNDYDTLKGVFGCGLFDLWNIWWPNRVQVDNEICIYYAARKGGFDLPVRTRSEVIVVDQCNLSIIE
jgi:hypothetical protein